MKKRTVKTKAVKKKAVKKEAVERKVVKRKAVKRKAVKKGAVKKADAGGPFKHSVFPDHFFSTDAEKTKLNWFLFEYAQECESFIQLNRRLRQSLTRKGLDDARIGELCVHYSKQMKQQILDKVEGRIPEIRIGYEPIESFLPEIGDGLVDQLLTVFAEAWKSQTDMCAICPTRCISERDRRAPMFDEPGYWE